MEFFFPPNHLLQGGLLSPVLSQGGCIPETLAAQGQSRDPTAAPPSPTSSSHTLLFCPWPCSLGLEHCSQQPLRGWFSPGGGGQGAVSCPAPLGFPNTAALALHLAKNLAPT